MKNLTPIILKTLDNSELLMPQGSLETFVTLEMPGATLTEIRSELRALESRRLVISQRDPLDWNKLKWKLTAEGKALLAESGI